MTDSVAVMGRGVTFGTTLCTDAHRFFSSFYFRWNLAQVPRVCRALEDSWLKCRDPTAVVLGLEEDLLECHERLRR